MPKRHRRQPSEACHSHHKHHAIKYMIRFVHAGDYRLAHMDLDASVQRIDAEIEVIERRSTLAGLLVSIGLLADVSILGLGLKWWEFTEDLSLIQAALTSGSRSTIQVNLVVGMPVSIDHAIKRSQVKHLAADIPPILQNDPSM
jgi:hypothetical protein